MVNTHNVNAAASSHAWPVLSEAERDAVVSRARVALFEYVRRARVDMDGVNWPALEGGLQVRINVTPELQRRFWSEPEKVIVEAMGDFAKWAETNETWQRLCRGE
jgi:hypothetical protein